MSHDYSDWNDAYMTGARARMAADSRIIAAMSEVENAKVVQFNNSGEPHRAAIAAIRAEAFAEAAETLTYPKGE